MSTTSQIDAARAAVLKSVDQPKCAPGYAEMMLRHLGPVVVDAITDDDITEIYVNPSDRRVRVHSRTRGSIEKDCVLATSRIELFLNAVAASHGQTLGADGAALEAELPQEVFRGSRLQAFVPPITSGPCFTIRKPASVVYSLQALVEQKALSETFRDVVRSAVASRHNILIVGGTNSGKTTLCNAVIHEMAVQCPGDRIVILEDTVELQCVAKDHLALRTAPGVSLAQLVKSALRACPNRIVVGEVRDHAALDLLDAWATGHPGGCATLHATSALGALSRLDRLAQRANVPSQIALIAEAIQLIVVIHGVNASGDARRALRHVVEVVHLTGLSPHGEFVLER